MAYPVAEMMQKLLEAGYSSTEAANMVAADAQRQAEERQAVSTTTTLRNQYGGFDLSKAKDFFSHARKQEEAKKYFDPLEGMQSVDSMSKHEQMDMIRGKHVGKTENISPLQSVNAGVDFFKKLREGK
ncbi:hypothetical protein [Klebsiella pneumoniae]|uniref:hypothetical protein n=1 Tax=Klebsiella pneumoniae TaxID=573 RepID=UPI0008137EC1|nr:hypothetical protein [Klebsiella pneumoniae]MCQ8313685.1 hypothetical protein [Klebsiella pneumoniae]MCZ3409256.1 hypothetical protein [Klebsiella pneumoniae]MDP1197091.1 hypothetical protein [Klebsiella pneumoniae]SWD99724.1 Uncharacterised protein [Klebsiella pneumoniae]